MLLTTGTFVPKSCSSLDFILPAPMRDAKIQNMPTIGYRKKHFFHSLWVIGVRKQHTTFYRGSGNEWSAFPDTSTCLFPSNFRHSDRQIYFSCCLEIRSWRMEPYHYITVRAIKHSVQLLDF